MSNSILKLRWIVAAWAVCCLALANAGAADNLFPTGDMESGGTETTAPLHWSERGNDIGQGTIGVSTDTPTGTGQSLMAAGWDTPGYDYWTYSHDYSRWADTLWIRNGEDWGDKDFTLSYDYKGDVYLVMYGFGSAPFYAVWERVTEWTHVELVVTAPPDTTQFSFYLYDNSPLNSGDFQAAYLDNLSLVQVGGEQIPGDANLDGVVGDADLSLLLANWNQDATLDADGGWGRGEFDAVAPVQDNDLSLLLANWTPAGQVPEPATMCLLGLGGLTLIRRRR